MLETKNLSIAIETEKDKIYYISWNEMTDNQKEQFIRSLKTESYKEIGDLIKNIPKSHLLNRSPIRSLTTTVVLDEQPTLHLEQKSLGMIDEVEGYDEHTPPPEDQDVGITMKNTIEKAKEGCEKSIALLHAWAQSGDLQAKNALKDITYPSKGKLLPQSDLVP